MTFSSIAGPIDSLFVRMQLFVRNSKIKIIVAIALLVNLSIAPADAAITWSQTSQYDTIYDGKIPNSQYDLDFSSAYIFDNDPDLINFYLEFKNLPRTNMFNDGLNSFAFIGLDYNFDNKDDFRLYVNRISLKTDRSSVQDYAYNYKTEKYTSCRTSIFTNIDAGSKWVGIEVSRSCIGLPNSFDMYGYAEYNDANSGESYDYAPYPSMRVNLLGSSGGTASGSTSAGSTYMLPESIANSSKSAANFTEPPKDLSKLSEELLPSVVTVKCAGGSGTGWSAEAKLSSNLSSAGFKSIVITNHHVIEDCLGSKDVTLVLSNATSVAGKIVSWNESNDVAGVATSTLIPPLQWIGALPKQGWWVGVLGSPLGKANVLTTGIVSSINSLAKTFTLTAPINPGNSGGPVFDSTGRVLGLATSKNLLSSGVLAEGFGNAHGVPLLCATVISCTTEKDPWGGVSKFAAVSAAELEAAARAEAEAKAKAEAEAKAKAEAEAKAKAEAEAKLAYETKIKEELRKKCIEINGDLDLAKFNIKNAINLYPASLTLLQGVFDNAPDYLDCVYFTVSTFDAELQGKRKILTAYELSVNSAIASAQMNATKKTTITCVKGKLTKKVTAVNPKCPAGYKKK
jgi:S1-C subfamily serine protease